MHTIHYITLCTCISDVSDMHTNYSTNYLPYKQQPGNAQFSSPLVVPYFTQSLGAWVPLPNNLATPQSYQSPSRHGCWCPMCPFWGVCFHQSCIQNTCITFKLHSMYQCIMCTCITCTVKSPTSPTCVSFKLFNILHVHVLHVQLSLQCLRHVYSFKLQ